MKSVQWLVFACLAAFWGTMNVWLWRSEFGADKNVQGGIPPRLIWEKILTAPDHSNLEIFQRTNKVGYCRWTPTVGEDSPPGTDPTAAPEGMVRTPTGYTLDLEGNIALEKPALRLRLNLFVELDRRQVWRTVRARAVYFKSNVDIEARADTGKMTVKFTDGGESWSREVALDDASEPGRLLADLAGIPIPPRLLEVQAALPGTGDTLPPVEWQVASDHLWLGHSRLRVYRMRARWLDRWQAEVVVTRVGEILRVELPGGVRFQNEILSY